MLRPAPALTSVPWAGAVALVPPPSPRNAARSRRPTSLYALSLCLHGVRVRLQIRVPRLQCLRATQSRAVSSPDLPDLRLIPRTPELPPGLDLPGAHVTIAMRRRQWYTRGDCASSACNIDATMPYTSVFSASVLSCGVCADHGELVAPLLAYPALLPAVCRSNRGLQTHPTYSKYI